MRFTVIGSGNSGLIHAAKIYEKGFEVGVLKTSDYGDMDFFNRISAKNAYNVDDETNGTHHFEAKMAFITRDVKKAVEFADVLFVMTTTLQHEDVAQKIAPFVRDGQIIILVPGYMGSLIFKKYIKKDITYCEWETTAYNGRIMNSEYVRITFYNPRNAISTLPASRANDNPNMIVHPIGVLFSSARIEYSKGEFWMYKEAFTPSVVKVINAFDKCKNQVLNAFGCPSLDYFEAAKWRNEEDLSKDAMEVFHSFADSSNKGPMSINHRYLNEDVPMGLGLLTSIGKIAGVDMSIPEAIMALASALLQKDFKSQARSIQWLLGKDDVTIDDIKKAIS